MARRLIDQDPRREQRRQNILLDRLELQFRAAIRQALSDAILKAVRVYEGTGEVPRTLEMQRELDVLYRRLAETSVRVFGARVMEQGKSLGHDLEAKSFAELFARIALSYVGQEVVRQRITNVSENTRQQVVSAVAAGLDAGLGVAEIAKGIRSNVQTMTGWRAAMIARTETHGAANYGAQEAAKETGLTLNKEWVSAEDARTRPDHDRANGQIVPQDQPFIVGGDRLMHPGDPRGDADQVINCRCSVSYVVVE